MLGNEHRLTDATDAGPLLAKTVARGTGRLARPARSRVEQRGPPVRQVLVLQSFDRGVLALDQFTANFRVDLDQRTGEPVNLMQFVVTPGGFITPPEEPVVDFLRCGFRRSPPLRT